MSPTAPIVLIGLDEPEAEALGARLGIPTVHHPDLPRYKVQDGVFLVERPAAPGMVRAGGVVFHGIFEEDFELICALTLWGGPVFPRARGMMDCRLKLPCLLRAAAISRFGAAARGFAPRGVRLHAQGPTVAKWGNWHCGENKVVYAAHHDAEEPTWTEPFWRGRSVRVVRIGGRAWQIGLEGEGWLKSIHHPDAHPMPLDPALAADAEALCEGLGLDMAGIDYLVEEDGTPHLLEVNHIPSVTTFAEIRAAWIEAVAAWAGC